MAYGTVKVDNITFTNGGIDQTVTVSGIVQSISGNITATGTIQAATIIGTSTVSGATVTGNAGVFTTVTGGSAGFTTVTGTTVTGTTANFATISGTTITGGALTVASGTFSGNSTAAAFIPTGSTVPTNGLYLPTANSVALSTNSTGRLFINSSGNIGIGVSSPGDRLHVVGPTAGISARFSDGVNATLAISHPSSGTSKIADYGGNYGFELAGSSVNFLTAGSERMRLDSSGRLGIGSSSPGYPLTVKTATDGGQAILDLDNQDAGNYGGLRVHLGKTDRECRLEATYTSSFFSFYTDSAERMRVTSTGVGIGTTSPSKALEVAAGNTSGNGILVTGSNSPRILLTETGGNVTNWIAVDASAAYAGTISNHPYNIYTNSLERCRVDTSGRLLVGTSSARGYGDGNIPFVQVERATIGGDIANIGVCNNGDNGAGPKFTLAKSRSGSNGGVTVVQNGDSLGSIQWSGADGTDIESVAAQITCNVDGTPGANDMPGRLVFSTTADGASSPTERMRIGSNGTILIGKTTAGIGNAGIELDAVAQDAMFTTYAATPVYVNRTFNDGVLIDFQQDSTTEGSISVSGTTVSYNGAHLSRWSQLPSGAERTEILRGTVLSNIDEMCEWGDEDNEQLNRMKVSDVEGDKNVSGVFQGWDDDDDTYTNDFYCAMTGDFIIRIGAGITVERGDLLMSAGDGTAKPQDDDIIRSKTVAKVTSTNVSCTYDDGSYCVPCVLMAC